MSVIIHPNPARVLDQVAGDIRQELKEVEFYALRHKKKLQIVQQFVIHWNKRSWKVLEEELSSIESLNFLDLEDLNKQKKYDKATIEAVIRIKVESPDEVNAYFKDIIKRMRTLNKIFKKLRKNLLAQKGWLEKNKDSIWKQHENIQPLLRLIRDEANLLYKHGLAGHRNERDILYGIYNMIMPLKERLLQWEKIKRGMVSRKTKYQFMGQDPAIMKRIGAKKKEEWSEINVRRRIKIMRDYYDYLSKRGVPLPSQNAIYTISKSIASDQGVRPSGYYSVAVKQQYGGVDGRNYFRKQKKPETIKRIYTKMLVALNRATAGRRNKLEWLYDFSPQNFVITPGRNILFIDIDPPGWDWPHYNFKRFTPRRIKRYGTAGSSNRDYFLRHATTKGQFIHLLEHSCGARIDLKEMFIQTTLDFLKKVHRYDLLRFLEEYVKSHKFRNNIKLFAAY